MLRNYLTIAIRNLLKRKIYSFINISGLSVGFAAVILIFLYLKDELSYDRFHDKAENLYRVAWFSDDPQTRTPHPMAQAMVRDFAEVESAVSLSPIWGPGLTPQIFTLKRPEDENWTEEREALAVDSTFFDVFSFKLISGNPKTVLRNAGGIVISESMAKKYFGEVDPMGKFLMINNDSTLLQVEGVFEDVPSNSHFHFHALVSYVTMKQYSGPESEYYTWKDFGHFNYIRLIDGADPKFLESKLLEWVAGYLDLDQETLQRVKASGDNFKLQPVVDIHLKSALRWELEPNGNIGYIYIMTAAAIFILVIACFNFMNLTTARSIERASEIGVRKVNGASRMSLYQQFLGESIILTLMAIILAGLIVELSLPSFNTFTNKELQLEVSNPMMLAILLGAAILIGILSGLYPSAFLSALRPVEILKGKHSHNTSGRSVRRILVILQFAISIFLISGFMVIYDQMNFLKNKPLGFNKESVVVIPIKEDETRERFESLQTEVTSLDGVISLSASSNIPGRQFNQNPIWLDTAPENVVNISQIMVDYEIFKTLGLQIVEGRNFSQENPSDRWYNFIINERAVQALNLENPVGSSLTLDLGDEQVKGEVIGVVKDFNFQSLHQPIRPLVFQLVPAYNFAVMRVKMDDFDKTISSVASIWNEFDGNFEFQYDFLDEMIGMQYSKEQKMGVLFGSFSVLAIIIACLGLVAMATIDFANRRKEIGIRKVLGAPLISLVVNLLREYTIVVIISLVITSPVWWVIMRDWLNNFTFRIDLNPLIFILSGILLIALSWSTLGYLTFTTVRTNPVEALQEE